MSQQRSEPLGHRIEVAEGGNVVRAADVSLRILQMIAFAETPLGVTQVAQGVGIAKGAAHKHLRTLMDHGMVLQDPLTSLYLLGPKIWLMGQKAPEGQVLSEIAAPLMRSIRDELGLAVVLSVPTPKSAFVLATLPSNQPINIGVRPGSELLLHSSAQGKIFLAFGGRELREALREPLPRATPKTQTQLPNLLAELEDIRRLGYATAPEEAMLGINALAAPILDRSGKLIGSIGLIGSIQHLAAEPPPALLDRLFTLTATIGKRL
ncbi:IclR family transcriptional regulator [Xinfangfangia pollutisoli]|uniref:IclR family transcriptional regulator n=1 Tax=Xinfangfangia pollutisoli TaxID=2865960 RepID=UPI001CD6B36C|nr:IclR family transcriptional regulator [Xinfangfangia pollutisoli]